MFALSKNNGFKQTGGNLVYMIDDDLELCELVKIALETRNYKVKYALDGEKGLKMLMKKPPDLLLLDIKMPKVTGYELLQKIHSTPKLADIPIIVLTVITKGSRKSDEEWRDSMDVSDFITKPFEPMDLLKRVDRILKEESLKS